MLDLRISEEWGCFPMDDVGMRWAVFDIYGIVLTIEIDEAIKWIQEYERSNKPWGI